MGNLVSCFVGIFCQYVSQWHLKNIELPFLDGFLKHVILQNKISVIYVFYQPILT